MAKRIVILSEPKPLFLSCGSLQLSIISSQMIWSGNLFFHAVDDHVSHLLVPEIVPDAVTGDD